MNNPPTILMICSWLDHQSTVGIFFREQAKLMSLDFKFVLVNFRENVVGIRGLIKNRLQVDLKTQISEEGLEIIYLTYPRIWFVGSFLEKWFLKRTANVLIKHLDTRKISIQLIHAQSLFNAGYWAYWLNDWYNIPYLITEHNQISLYGVKSEKRLLIDKIFANSKRNLVVSFDKIRQFATNNIFSEFEVVGNCVNEDLFNYKPLKSGGAFEIMTIGAYTPIKDHKTMLKALKIVDDLETNVNVNFTWLGFNAWGGNLKAGQINSLIASFGFKRIKFHLIDVANRKEVSECLGKANLFLFSSIVEGMPVSVLEALSSGVPVCSTMCGGVDEIIRKENGKIVQVKDYNGMASFIESVIREEITFDREEISKAAINKFGSMAFRDRMLNIYCKALGA